MVNYPFHRRITVNLDDRSVNLPASGLDLHPTGDNWWGMEISTGVTGSDMNYPQFNGVNTTTTASLKIRAFAGAADVLYSVTTTNFLHPHPGHHSTSNINLLVYQSAIFTFVVTSHPPEIANLCRQALAAGQATTQLLGEFQIIDNFNHLFTSDSFPVTCHVPVIRPESF